VRTKEQPSKVLQDAVWWIENVCIRTHNYGELNVVVRLQNQKHRHERKNQSERKCCTMPLALNKHACLSIRIHTLQARPKRAASSIVQAASVNTWLETFV
jgi:hypothetical protein